MYSVVATNINFEAINIALGQENVFWEIGEYDSHGIRAIFRKIVRTPIDILIIDLSVGPKNNIVSGIRDFIISRPNTRIMILGTEEEPGDPVISQLISLGIYDLIITREKDELIRQIRLKIDSQKPAYSEVARWHVLDKNYSKDKGDKKEIIFQDKLVGTAYIAVAAGNKGMGATTTALSIASYLAGVDNHTVAYIDMKKNPSTGSELIMFKTLYNLDNAMDGSCFSFKEIDFYFGDIMDIVSNNKKYNYIIMDLGILNTKESQEEIGRASLGILMVGNSLFRIKKDLSSYTGLLDKLKVVFLPGEDEEVEEIKKEILDEYYNIPSIPNPFNLSDDAKMFLKKLLIEVLPKKEEIKKRGFLFWKQ